MAIGKITGTMLYNNLERQGVDLAIDANLTYWSVTNRRVGINNSNPLYSLDSPGNAKIANLVITGNSISSNTGVINLGTIKNITIGGGSASYVLTTDGSGNLNFDSISNVITAGGAFGNTITLGANTVAALVSNAVTLTTTTKVTDAISQLNYVLGKLVPPSPPPFPNSTTITLSTATTAGYMTGGWSQTDNSGWGNLAVSAGTAVNAVRTAVFTTSAVTNSGPGNQGTVTAYLNGVPNGNVTLTGSNANTTDGNLYVYNVQDYHNVVSSVTAGFWSVFSTYATATGGMKAGWNRVYIYDSGTATSTNNVTWYYDNSVPGTPTFANTSLLLTSNSVTYSSTIPHFNSSTTFKFRGNVNNLSGDLYNNSPFTASAGGAFATPTTPTYASFILPTITTPLAHNYLTAGSGQAYFETPVSITTGFGSSNSGPTITFNNTYATGSSGAVTTGGSVLYKTGTSTQIEETSIPVSGSLGSGYATNAARIANPDSGTAADNPTYTGTEATFNSQTGPFYITDATVTGAVLKFDQNNYSTGWLPVGPNLSGQSSTQYFTFKFQRSTVSKFDIQLTTGSTGIAGCWVALPGVTDASYASPTKGWLNMNAAYAGSGAPGTGTGGNGSAGCALSGNMPLNSQISGTAYTCTFGTLSSTNSTSNEIYVRIKLTSGQTVTAIQINTASH